MSIHQYVCLLGTHIPWYGICVGLALLGIGMWMIYNFKKFTMNGDQQNEILFGFPFMMLTGVLIALLLDAFFTGDNMKPIGLYLHIPFCNGKCPYCDFYSGTSTPEEREAYVAALTEHIKGECKSLTEHTVDTVPADLDRAALPPLMEESPAFAPETGGLEGHLR